MENKISIKPFTPRGSITPPPSKSISHRTLICAALSEKNCLIENFVMSEDLSATVSCLAVLGAAFEYDSEKRHIIIGESGFLSNLPDVVNLECGQSASTMRFIIPVSLLSGKKIIVRGERQLMHRPVIDYENIYGIGCEYRNDSICFDGNLKAGLYRLPGGISSQFLSGLLFALPMLAAESEIIAAGTESADYIELTVDAMKKHDVRIKRQGHGNFFIRGAQKYKPYNHTIEADFSQAAFFLVCGAMNEKSELYINGLNMNSMQGDKVVVDILKACGAYIMETNGVIYARRGSNMLGIEINADDIPDLVPLLALFFTQCEGISKIYNAGRLRYKESDRLNGTARELAKLGADISAEGDSLIIRHSRIRGGDALSMGDHRIIMMLCAAAAVSEAPVEIHDIGSYINKSYINFFRDFALISGQNF